MDIKQIRYLEKIAADGHKALEIEKYNDWELRFSKGYTGRANSVRIMGDPIEEINKDVEDKLRYAEADYSYLQVIKTNEIAINLYKKFGYEILYTYWYLVKK